MRKALLKSGGMLLLLGAASCAPTYVLNVKPARSTGFFAAGREQAWAVADSMEVRLNFVAYEPARLVFNVEYRNPTRQPLLVDPAAFRYVPTRIPGPANLRHASAKPPRGMEVTAATALPQPLPALPAAPIMAFDPELQITALHTEADREATRAQRFDWLGLALTVTSVAVDVGSLGQRETQAQFQARNALREGVAAYNIVSATNKMRHAVTADVLEGKANTLQNFALRKVTLAPGQQVRGYLYFPRFDTADGMQMQVPVSGQVLPLEFVQTRTRQ